MEASLAVASALCCWARYSRETMVSFTSDLKRPPPSAAGRLSRCSHHFSVWSIWCASCKRKRRRTMNNFRVLVELAQYYDLARSAQRKPIGAHFNPGPLSLAGLPDVFQRGAVSLSHRHQMPGHILQKKERQAAYCSAICKKTTLVQHQRNHLDL